MRQYQLVMTWNNSQVCGKVFDNVTDAANAAFELRTLAIQNKFECYYHVIELTV